MKQKPLKVSPNLRVLDYFYPIEMGSDTSDISPFTHFSNRCTKIAVNIHL